MILPQPMAARPLALLTLAVAAAHLLVLGQAGMREAPRPAGMRALVMRVVNVSAPETQLQAPAAKPVLQERRAIPRVRPVPRTETRPEATAATSIAESLAAAPATPPFATTTTPAPLSDIAPAPAPVSVAASAASSSPAMAFAIPGSVRLRYGVTGHSRGQTWNLSGQLLWRHDGSQYEARLDYSAPLLPSRSQQSTGRITAEGLAPLRFSDKSRSEQATHFERDSGTLVFSNNAPQQPLLPGVQDRLSVFLQLASMLAAEPLKFPAGTSITLQTAGTRDAQPWQFMVDGDETLDLPGGRVATRKLTRSPRGEYDIRVELWLGTAMDYVPVRIRLTQPNGDYVDQQWASTDRS